MLFALFVLFATAKEPKVELKPTPRVTMMPGGTRAAVVRFRLTVNDGGREDYYCPKVEWEWHDGTKSSEESDCPPFGEATPSDHDRIWSHSREYWEAGQHVVTVRLFKGERMIRKVEATVDIRGESVPDGFRERD
jgi:hypothetical protein